MSFIERLRTKPKHIRSRYAFIFALLITLVIAGIWQISLSARLATFGQPDISEDGPSATSQFSEPLQKARDRMQALFEDASTTNGTSTPTAADAPSLPQAYDLIITGTTANTSTPTATSSAQEREVKTILIATSTKAADPQ